MLKQLTCWMVAAFFSLTFGCAAAGDVLIGPGDTIKVSVYNNPDLTLETRVSESGNITYPLIGEVKIGGLAVQSAEKKSPRCLSPAVS